MIPLVSLDRAISGGAKSVDNQWSPKLTGNLREGDPALTSFTIEGRAEIRELGGHIRLFLRDIKVVKRPLVITDKLKDELRQRVEEEKKDSLTIGESADEEDEAAQQEKEEALQQMIEKERARPVNIPSLRVYLTDKKPKTRMVDAHKAGVQMRFDTGSVGENLILKENQPFQIAGLIKDLPESLLMKMQGLVILKLPQDKPTTPEPVIYAFARLESARNIKVRLFLSHAASHCP